MMLDQHQYVIMASQHP